MSYCNDGHEIYSELCAVGLQPKQAQSATVLQLPVQYNKCHLQGQVKHLCRCIDDAQVARCICPYTFSLLTTQLCNLFANEALTGQEYRHAICRGMRARGTQLK